MLGAHAPQSTKCPHGTTTCVRAPSQQITHPRSSHPPSWPGPGPATSGAPMGSLTGSLAAPAACRCRPMQAWFDPCAPPGNRCPGTRREPAPVTAWASPRPPLPSPASRTAAPASAALPPPTPRASSPAKAARPPPVVQSIPAAASTPVPFLLAAPATLASSSSSPAPSPHPPPVPLGDEGGPLRARPPSVPPPPRGGACAAPLAAS